MNRRYLYNFPDGLSAGTYTFDYIWTSPDEILDCTLEVEFTN